MTVGEHIDRALRFAWRQKRTIPVLLLLVIAVLLTRSLKWDLDRTAWSLFRDGGDIERTALDPDLRTVLWARPEPLPAAFNVPSDITDPCFSPDGLTMVFSRTPTNKISRDLFYCRWTGHYWTNVSTVAGVNWSDSNESSPTFSRDGRYLLFASDRDGGLGSNDLWVARWRNGRCSKILNLGAPVNTRFNETDPSLTSDGELFFASDRVEGDGPGRDYNILLARPKEPGESKSKETGLTAFLFEEPLQLPVFRSVYQERHPEMSRHSDLLYFSSDRRGGRGGYDIYLSRVRDGVPGPAENLTGQINSSFDDLAPALRCEGFELVYSANGRLRRAIMREVKPAIDLSRVHRLLVLIDSLKWWILAVIGAALLIYYLLRHWKDFTNLFQKCLIGSLVIHLIMLLMTAGVFIAAEISATSRAVSMEVAIDADALAREKMALDMQDKVVSLTPSDVDVVVEQARQDVEMPEFTPQEIEPDRQITTQTSEESFVARVTASAERAQDTPDQEQAELDVAELPELALPEIDIEMEEAKTPAEAPAEPAPAESEAPVIRDAIDVAFAETPMEPTPMPEPTPETTPVPEPVAAQETERRAEVSVTESIVTDQAEVRPVDVEPQLQDPVMPDMPAMEVPESTVDAGEDQGPEVDATAHQQPVAVEFVKDTVEVRSRPKTVPVNRHLVTNYVEVAAVPVGTRPTMSERKDIRDATPGPHAALEDNFSGPPVVPQLSQMNLSMETPEGTVQQNHVEATDVEIDASVALAETEQADMDSPGAAELLGSFQRPVSEGTVPSAEVKSRVTSALVRPEQKSRVRVNAARERKSAQRISAASTAVNDTVLRRQLPAQVPGPPILETPAGHTESRSERPLVAAALQRTSVPFQEHDRLAAATGPRDPVVSDHAGTRVHAADTGIDGPVALASAGVERQTALPSLAGVGSTVSIRFKTSLPDAEFRINAPGKLDIPEGANKIISPDALRRPGELSADTIKGLGGSERTQKSVASALTWFGENQERNGRWDIRKHGGEEGHDVAATSLILLCYYGWGATHLEDGPYRATVSKAIEWLLGQMEKGRDGSLSGRLTGKGGNMYDHAMATIALCEAYGLSHDEALRGPAAKAVAYIVTGQHPEKGGWRYEPGEDPDLLVTGWQYLALKSAQLAGLHVEQEVFDRAEKWIDVCAGNPDTGTYSYQPGYKHRSGVMHATGMFTRQLAGVPPSDPRMQRGAGYFSAHPFKADGLDFYYLYYGTLALYQHQGRKWEKWNARMKKILPELQREEDAETGSWDPSGHLADRMGRAVTTAMATLSLEVYYRILPIYGFRDDTAE